MKIYKIWSENQSYNLNEIFLKLKEISDFSRDPHTKVGCAIVDNKQRILMMGYNDYPDTLNELDITQEMKTRPEKYHWIEHAERNTIFACARKNISLKNRTMITNLCPCIDCARAIVESSISRIITHRPNDGLETVTRWKEHMIRSLTLFDKSNVNVTFFEDLSDKDKEKIFYVKKVVY